MQLIAAPSPASYNVTHLKKAMDKSCRELGWFWQELALLRKRWHIILACLVFQYVHGIFTQLAYRNHRPAETLHDIGFALLPELPAQWRWLSEALFASLLIPFIIWTFTPLLRAVLTSAPQPPAFSCVLLWTRLLTVLVVCQSLRILSFSSTQLPGPAPHCRPGTPTAHRAPAEHWWQHVVVDVGRQLGSSCGDLLFSSHMTFVLVGVLTYQHHGGNRIVKALAWTVAVAIALLIISARKHYTVDVVVAWYVVPLVYCCLNLYWRQQQLHAGQLPAAAALPYALCCSRDSCMHGACGSCGDCSCSCSCYSPHRKSPQLLPPRSSSPLRSLQLAGIDGRAVITFPAAGLKVPAGPGVKLPASAIATTTNSPTGWGRLGAVWAPAHRRAGSDGSCSSGSSDDCSTRLQDSEHSGPGAV